MSAKKSVRKQWTKEEDNSLLKLITQYGTNGCWPQIAEKMVARSGKQCRERYINHLDPDIKRTPWSKQEDEVIRKLFPSVGTKWSQYIEYLPGRSDNAIKNRYHVISRYGMKSSSSQNDLDSEVICGRKRSIPTGATLIESDEVKNDYGVETPENAHHKRMERLQTARDMLDKKIRELEESGSYLSGSASPSDLSTTFCEETIMSELDNEFDDFNFLWSGNEAILVQKREVPVGISLGFDFDNYEVQT